MDRIDCLVIGAGVVGLAVARALALTGLETVIAERHRTFGSETSSRNSGVIHAGIYYPPNSLKARLCVRGRELLYGYCAGHGVSHRRSGKLIVATADEQHDRLGRLHATAAANGVDDLRWLDRDEALQLEPALHCTAALLSPSTGIVDAHGYMLALLGEAQDRGAALALGSTIAALSPAADGLLVRLEGEAQPQLLARSVVNCAGLRACDVAAAIEGFPRQHIPRPYYCKGNYYGLAGRAPFTRLIYPLPEQAGVGIHLTLDLGGAARFGPDVEWVDTLDYEVEPGRAERFYDAIRQYWPALQDGALVPAYSGIRPKIVGPSEASADFRIEGPEVHGVPGVINLFGIESPGLTASLAIAEHVVEMTRKCL